MAAVDGATCRTRGCTNLAGRYVRKCFDHAYGDWSDTPSADDAKRTDDPILAWDIVCLLCGDRRAARGTFAQARATMPGLPPCRECGGSLIVENSEVGSINSPSAVHSAIYQPGYGVPSGPRAAA